MICPRSLTWGLVLAVGWLGAPPSSWAQKAPEVGYVWPPSAVIGQATEVVLGGYDWTPDTEILTSDPRVRIEMTGELSEVLIQPPPYLFGSKSTSPQAPLPREVPARITVAADMPPGPVRWQVANANGGSVRGVFYLVTAPDVVEVRRRGPQTVPALPTACAGRLLRLEEVDRWNFTPEQSGLVTCELFSRRVGANCNLAVDVRDASGRSLAELVDTQGLDGAVTFPVTAGQRYELRVHEVDFRGDWSYVYRLQLRWGSRVVTAVPPLGRRGETREVEFFGPGLATGGAAAWESVKQAVNFPADPQLREFTAQVNTPAGPIPCVLQLTDLATTLLTDDSPAARKITQPQAFVGVLRQPFGPERFSLVAKKGEWWSLTANARRHGARMDLSLAILDSEGKELVRNDDAPGTLDAALSWLAPADGEYTLLLTDASQISGTAAAVYSFEAAIERPGFALRGPELLNIPLGGKADLTITATRTGGFVGPIRLALQGLPEGVSVEGEPVLPENKLEAKLSLVAAADAPAASGPVTVSGSADVDGQTLTQTALMPASGNLAPRTPEEALQATTLVTSIMKRRARVAPVDKDGGRTVHRGTTWPADVTIERYEGFTGEVLLRMAARQSYQQHGIRGTDVLVPPGETMAQYPCFMPEWLETSRTSRMILVAWVQAPDPRGRLRWLVSPMDGRITMSMEGALLRINHEAPREARCPAGSAFSIPCRISRSPKLPENVTLEVAIPEELQGLVTADPVRVPPDAATAQLTLRTKADPALLGEYEFSVRASALERGRWPVLSESTFVVEFVAAEQ